MSFPAGLTTITVTGLNLLALDGSPLNGVVLFTPSGDIPAPAVSTLLAGSAVGEVINGVMTPLLVPTTDCVTPGFTYTISFRLQGPDGVTGNPAPLAGVSIPHTLGATVDLSVLVPAAPPPSPTAFGTPNTWTATQTFDGAPPVILGGALAPAVVALAYGAVIAVDASKGNDFRVTLTGNATISTPSNPQDGQLIEFQLTQDSSGGHVVTWGAGYDFGSQAVPTLSGASKTDIIGFKYNSTRVAWLFVGATLGF